jgi:hypothetical protein
MCLQVRQFRPEQACFEASSASMCGAHLRNVVAKHYRLTMLTAAHHPPPKAQAIDQPTNCEEQAIGQHAVLPADNQH